MIGDISQVHTLKKNNNKKQKPVIFSVEEKVLQLKKFSHVFLHFRNNLCRVKTGTKTKTVGKSNSRCFGFPTCDKLIIILWAISVFVVNWNKHSGKPKDFWLSNEMLGIFTQEF